MKSRRLSPPLSSLFPSSVFSSDSIPLLAIALFVLLVRPPSFAGGIKCVQCGPEKGDGEPCGQVLPKPTLCAGPNDKSCFVGARLNKTTGHVLELRRCSESDDYDQPDDELKNKVWTYGLLCGPADGCNADQSPSRPVPLPAPDECPPSKDVGFGGEYFSGPPPPIAVVACVQCGGGGGSTLEPCGAKLPAATSCKAKDKSCVSGASIDVNVGKVEEKRWCVSQDDGDYQLEPGDGTALFGLTCQTAGCNVDAERYLPDSQCAATTTSPGGGNGDDVTTSSPGGDGDGAGAAGNSAAAASSPTINPTLLMALTAAVVALAFGASFASVVTTTTT